MPNLVPPFLGIPLRSRVRASQNGCSPEGKMVGTAYLEGTKGRTSESPSRTHLSHSAGSDRSLPVEGPHPRPISRFPSIQTSESAQKTTGPLELHFPEASGPLGPRTPFPRNLRHGPEVLRAKRKNFFPLCSSGFGSAAPSRPGPHLQSGALRCQPQERATTSPAKSLPGF